MEPRKARRGKGAGRRGATRSKARGSPPRLGKRAASGAAPAFVVLGQVVTMDADSRVLPAGAVYVSQGTIVDVKAASAPAPTGFAGAPRVDSGGTIFPGLLELHNHLAYDVLPLWKVPQKFQNRAQWQDTVAYKTLVTKPMGIVGKNASLLPAICRYVECKCLFGGVTTSQGIRLVSAAGIGKYFRGLVRNVEQPADKALPAASSLIADPDATDPRKFWATLQAKAKGGGAYLLHLSEGLDAAAEKHFASLDLGGGTWAINGALAGIHCAALTPGDFGTLAGHGGSMVWSPMSNMLLYGGTADVAAAKAAGVPMGIGADWSPSGSKNLLGELKVALLYSAQNGNLFSPEDIVGMATTAGARILKWGDRLGSLEAGKYADLLAVEGTSTNPCEALIRSKETGIHLVVVGGVPRYGLPDLMGALGASGEQLAVGGQWRSLFAEDSDPEVPGIAFAQASAMLSEALGKLPELAAGAEGHLSRALSTSRISKRGWTLALDEVEDTGQDPRPRLSVGGSPTGPALPRTAAASTPVAPVPVRLDPPTVVDDPQFLDLVEGEGNPPAWLRQGLRGLY